MNLIIINNNCYNNKNNLCRQYLSNLEDKIYLMDDKEVEKCFADFTLDPLVF